MAQRIGKLVDSGLRGSDVTLSWFMCCIQPLQFRTKLICQFSDMKDAMCITEHILLADSVSQRARQLWKVAKDNSDLTITVDTYTTVKECLRVSKSLIIFMYLFFLFYIYTSIFPCAAREPWS